MAPRLRARRGLAAGARVPRAAAGLRVDRRLRPHPSLPRACGVREEPGSNAPDTLHVVRDEEIVWQRDLGVRSGTLAETPQLSVRRIEVDSGEASAAHAHTGDELLYVLAGTLWVRARHADATYVFELGPEDACLLPGGSEHEYRNYGAVTAETLVGIAPNSDA